MRKARNSDDVATPAVIMYIMASGINHQPKQGGKEVAYAYYSIG